MPAATEDTPSGDATGAGKGVRSPYGSVPPPPKPSADAGIKDSIPSPSTDSGAVPISVEALDITTLSPLAALNLLTASVKSTITDGDGDLVHSVMPMSPKKAGFERSERDGSMASQDGTFDLPIRTARYHKEVPNHHKTPIGSPEAGPQEGPDVIQPPQLSLDGALSDYDYQCIAMAKTFHCKVPPPIPLNAYLERIHRYCPMSTAVYLAAAHYIQRITHELWEPEGSEVEEVTYVQITPRSVHRLVLAALRIATKALEDHNWQHSRFAGVGGVPEASLTRLELAMCYLLEFDLFISKDALCDAAKWMLGNAA